MSLPIVTANSTLKRSFNTTRFTTAAPHTLAGTPSLHARVDGGAGEITTGFTLTADFDGKTGENQWVLDLSASASYTAGSIVEVFIAAGTVDSVSVVGLKVYEFQIGTSGSLDALVTRGLLALPAVAHSAAGGLPTVGTGTGQISLSSGNVKATDTSGNALAVSSTALSTANWTTARAGYLDNINNAALQTTVAQTGDSYGIVNSGTHGNAAIKGFVDDIGVAGAGLSAIPWNAAWDAEAQSECADALAAYGAATAGNVSAVETDTQDIQSRLPAALGANGNMKADARDWLGTALATPDTAGYPKTTIKDGTGTGELDTASGKVALTAGSVTEIQLNLATEANATSNAATLAGLINAVGVIVTAIQTTIGIAGAGLTAIWSVATRTITGFTTAGKAEVQQEVQDAIEANHLDHLLAAEYDPASKPGVATALLNELIGSDAGVSQFTANALELAPTGGGGGAGTGARTVVITVNDGAAVLENARVRVTQGAETYVLSTNVSGQATFNLDDATWTVAITKAGYLFAGASLIVNGNETQTYSMTLVAISPSDPGATTGYVTIRTNGGVPIEDVVVQVQVMKFANGTTGSGIDDPLASGTTDSNGFVEFPGLPRLASYRVRVGTGGKWYTGTTLDAASTPLAGVLGLAE